MTKTKLPWNKKSAIRCKMDNTKSKKKYYFDQQAADRALNFIEDRCKHPDSGDPFILEQFQRDIITDAFGWMVMVLGTRKHKFVYFEIPKGNGKSRLLSAIGTYLLCFDKERSAEIYVCAGDRQQAGIIFEDTKKMIEEDLEVLAPAHRIFKDTIVHTKSGSKFKAISSEAYSKHGYRPHGILFDELHVQPNRTLYDTLTKGVMKKPNPQVWMITTAGVANTFGHDISLYSRAIMDGVIENEYWLCRIYSADPEDDPFSVKTWKKANPGYGTIIKPEAFKVIVKEAKTMGSGLNSFLRLHLNIWTGAIKSFIPDHEWVKCKLKAPKPDDLIGADCFGGLDLASTRDLCSFSLFFPDINRKHQTIFKIYCPAETVTARDLNENVNYSKWVREGLITVTPGNVTDYNFIKKDIFEAAEKYNLIACGYDRFNSSQLISECMEEGVNMSPFGMGYLSMNEPTKKLEEMILKKVMNHNGNEVLRWQNTNMVIDTDPAGNIKPTKKRSKEKIDTMVALIISIGEYLIEQSNSSRSIYEDRGIVGF